MYFRMKNQYRVSVDKYRSLINSFYEYMNKEKDLGNYWHPSIDFLLEDKKDLDKKLLNFLKNNNITNIKSNGMPFYIMALQCNLSTSYQYFYKNNLAKYNGDRHIREIATMMDGRLDPEVIQDFLDPDLLKRSSIKKLRNCLEDLESPFAVCDFKHGTLIIGKEIIKILFKKKALTWKDLDKIVHFTVYEILDEFIKDFHPPKYERVRINHNFEFQYREDHRLPKNIFDDMTKTLDVLLKNSFKLKNKVYMSEGKHPYYKKVRNRVTSDGDLTKSSFNDLSGFSNVFIQQNLNKVSSYTWDSFKTTSKIYNTKEVTKHSLWLKPIEIKSRFYYEEDKIYFPRKFQQIFYVGERIFYKLKYKNTSFNASISSNLHNDLKKFYYFAKTCKKNKANNFILECFINQLEKLDFQTINEHTNNYIFKIVEEIFFSKKVGNPEFYILLLGNTSKKIHKNKLRPIFTSHFLDNKKTRFGFDYKQRERIKEKIKLFVEKTKDNPNFKEIYKEISAIIINERPAKVDYEFVERDSNIVKIGLPLCWDKIRPNTIEEVCRVLKNVRQYAYLEWFETVPLSFLESIQNWIPDIIKLETEIKTITSDRYSIINNLNKELSFKLKLKDFEIEKTDEKYKIAYNITKVILDEKIKNNQVPHFQKMLIKDNPDYGHLIEFNRHPSNNLNNELKNYSSLTEYINSITKNKELKKSIYSNIFGYKQQELKSNPFECTLLIKLFKENTNYQKELWKHITDTGFGYGSNGKVSFQCSEAIFDILSKKELRRLILKLNSSSELESGISQLNDLESYKQLIEQYTIEYKLANTPMEPFVRPKKIKSIEELHTLMGKWVSKAKRNPFIKLYTNNKEIMRLDGIGLIHNKMIINVPKTSGELQDFSDAMSNCIGSYVNKINKGTSIVLNITREEKPYINVEIRDKKINEIKRRFNKRVDKQELDEISYLLKFFHLID